MMMMAASDVKREINLSLDFILLYVRQCSAPSKAIQITYDVYVVTQHNKYRDTTQAMSLCVFTISDRRARIRG